MTKNLDGQGCMSDRILICLLLAHYSTAMIRFGLSLPLDERSFPRALSDVISHSNGVPPHMLFLPPLRSVVPSMSFPSPPVKVALNGGAILNNPRFNKGTALSNGERDEFGISGRLPYT